MNIKVIHKERLDYSVSVYTFKLPPETQLLTVQMQHSTPTIWFLRPSPSDDEILSTLVIHRCPTGADLAVRPSWIYLGTVQAIHGELVWHYFGEWL